MSKYFIIAAMIIMGGFFGSAQETNAAYGIPADTVELGGYAWSGTIGWISMNCQTTTSCAADGGYDYGVTVQNDGTLTGYAWSSNVGWIKFDPAGSYPTGDGTVAQAAQRSSGTFPDLAFGGWARVCSAAADPLACSGTTNANAGGWDGWISLGNATSASVPYGLTMSAAGATASSYAWGGSIVMGWIDFSPVGSTPVTYIYDVTPPVVSFVCPTDPVAGGTVTCSYDPNGGGGDTADSCTLTSTAGDSRSIPASAGTLTVNPSETTTYTLVCSNSGVGSTPVDQTIEVRPDIVIANPSITVGSQNPATGAYTTVDVTYQVLDIPNGSNVNYEISLGTETQTGVINGTGAAQLISVQFTDVLFSSTDVVYTIEVDDSPSDGAVLEDLPSTVVDEDINFFEGTVTLSAPDPSIVVDLPEFVRTGEPADVGVTVTAIYDTTCEVFGPGFSSPSSTFTVTAGVTYTDTFTTADLTNSTTIAVRCQVPSAPDVSVSNSVEVTPAFQEV